MLVCILKWECVEGEEHWGMKFLRCKEQDGVVTRVCARCVRNTLVLLGLNIQPSPDGRRAAAGCRGSEAVLLTWEQLWGDKESLKAFRTRCYTARQ